jgi:hypothetical protein
MGLSISTLIPDIYRYVENADRKTEHILTSGIAEAIASRMALSLAREEGPSKPRLSKMGHGCPKAYWYSLHHPELAEPLPAHARIKFTYGHVLEALVIALAKASGHRVEGEQDELTLLDVKGHRDCVIDGATVDVKSCSSLQFEKVKNKTLGQSDPFAYLDQLDNYVVAAHNDPLVQVKDKGYILAVDKTLGHLALYEHTIRPEAEVQERVRRALRIFNQTEPPACECGTRPSGSSGNIELDVRASYSAFKHQCFPHLRTFLYSHGPKYLCHVERKPDVPELTRSGLRYS